MAHTLEELFDRQNSATLQNKVEGALLKESAEDISSGSPVNPDYAKIILHGGASGRNESKTVLRYLVGKYPDVAEPTQGQIETAVGEVYPKL